MSKTFDIKDYLSKNKIHTGTITRASGKSTYKGGYNDLRKTTYDVELDEDGKFNVPTPKEVITEASADDKRKLKALKNSLYDALNYLGYVSYIDDLSKFEDDAIKLQGMIDKFLTKTKL